jgi:hypothetical protein
MKFFLLKLVFIIYAVLLISCSESNPNLKDQYLRTQPIKPLMKDFIGINGHFNFKPELYQQVTKLVRNYHPISWDIVKPGDEVNFPFCVNGINWDNDVYGKWSKLGFEIDVCAEFGPFGPRHNSEYKKLWKGQEQWSYKYGYSMAQYFGPSGKRKLITSIEIGNEPGRAFDNNSYKNIFEKMARGIRAADPKIKIVTCNVHLDKANDYAKNLDETFGSPKIIKLFDVINHHVYAFKKEKYRVNPWERSYPEDPNINFLKSVNQVIAWRNKNAVTKDVWITEFGWDAVTDDMMSKRDGWFKKENWSDVTDPQQAQYLVRSLLCFSELDVQRAYIYYYDDNNVPSVHASSGITRNFEPKSSFWALKHLYTTLGKYRFNKIVRQEKDLVYVYEYLHGTDPKSAIWVLWSPTGSNLKKTIIVSDLVGEIEDITLMPTNEHPLTETKWDYIDKKKKAIKLEISESPTYILMNRTENIN